VPAVELGGRRRLDHDVIGGPSSVGVEQQDQADGDRQPDRFGDDGSDMSGRKRGTVERAANRS